jgi:CO/xanthine dehydrogenase FAD-binding subunit
VLDVDAFGRVAEARVAVGSCSATARRLHDLERDLVGQSANADIGGLVRAEHIAALSPINDVRATAGYRRDASLTLVRRTLQACAGRA